MDTDPSILRDGLIHRHSVISALTGHLDAEVRLILLSFLCNTAIYVRDVVSAKYLFSCLRHEIRTPMRGVKLWCGYFLQYRCFGFVVGVFVDLMEKYVCLDFIIVLD